MLKTSFFLIVLLFYSVSFSESKRNQSRSKDVNPMQDAGQITFVVNGGYFRVGETFRGSLLINVGTQSLGSFDLSLIYDPSIFAFSYSEKGGSLKDSNLNINTNNIGKIDLDSKINLSGHVPTGIIEIAKISFTVLSDDITNTIFDIEIAEVNDTTYSSMQIDSVASRILVGPPPTPTNTPSITNTPTPTPITPTPTNTSTFTPTPTFTPGVQLTLNDSQNIMNNIFTSPPNGFTPGRVRFGSIPNGNGVDAVGMAIDLFPGDGILVIFNEVFPMPSLAQISAMFQSTSQEASIALIALNSPIDNQFGYVNPSGIDVPIEEYKSLNLFYKPPSQFLQLGVQAINPADSSQSATIWIDNIRIIAYEFKNNKNVSLQVDGSFNHGISSLIQNINNVDGMIEPFFQSFNDVALRLSINENNIASNFGTIVNLSSHPSTIISSVDVFRETSVKSGGTMALVMTNGFQNIGVFRLVDQLPGFEMEMTEKVFIGGDFRTKNPDIPHLIIVQNGGPNANSSIIVDDLFVHHN